MRSVLGNTVGLIVNGHLWRFIGLGLPVNAKYTVGLIGTSYGVNTIQQTSSISMCILNTFAGSLLDVCWIV